MSYSYYVVLFYYRINQRSGVVRYVCCSTIRFFILVRTVPYYCIQQNHCEAPFLFANKVCQHESIVVFEFLSFSKTRQSIIQLFLIHPLVITVATHKNKRKTITLCRITHEKYSFVVPTVCAICILRSCQCRIVTDGTRHGMQNIPHLLF